MITHLGNITGYSKTKLSRVRRLLTLGVVAFTVLILVSLGGGWMMQQEMAQIYTSNYDNLAAAGFVDIIATPTSVNDKMVALVSIFPLIATIVVFPILLMCAVEVNKLANDNSEFHTGSEDAVVISGDFVHSNITRGVKVAKRSSN